MAVPVRSAVNRRIILVLKIVFLDISHGDDWRFTVISGILFRTCPATSGPTTFTCDKSAKLCNSMKKQLGANLVCFCWLMSWTQEMRVPEVGRVFCVVGEGCTVRVEWFLREKKLDMSCCAKFQNFVFEMLLLNLAHGPNFCHKRFWSQEGNVFDDFFKAINEEKIYKN